MTVFFRWCYAQAPLLLLIATLGWAGNAIAGKLSVNEISPMAVVFLRWTLVVAILGFIRRHHLHTDFAAIKNKKRWLVAMGLTGLTGFNALFYLAAHYTTAINLAMIQSVMPALIILGVAIIYKSRLSRIDIIGCILTISGVAVVVTKGHVLELLHADINFGDGLMLLACLCYASYTVGLRNRPALDSIGMMFCLSIVAWIGSFPLLAIEIYQGTVQFPSGYAWFTLLFIALFPSLTSQLFFMRAVDIAGPNMAGQFANMVPIYTSLLAVFLLGETFQLFHAISLALVGAGLWLVSRK